MSRKRRIPAYRLHKPSGQAVVRIDNRDHYLGKHDSKASREKYHRLVAEWLVDLTNSQVSQAPVARPSNLTISQLMLAYWEFVKSYYVKNSQPTDEQCAIRAALRPLLDLYAEMLVSEFGPLSLKVVREQMIRKDLCRSVINQNVGRIKRMFKWGVENELVPVAIHQALQTVTGLRQGRTHARESQPVKPVSHEIVLQTLPHIPPTVRDMIRFQLLTGCRPGEICILRPCDLDRSSPVWCYSPETHKTEHRDRERRIFIGPQAQEILEPRLDRPDDSYCFAPVRMSKSKDPLKPSRRKKSRRRSRSTTVSQRYTVDSYRRAISRACERMKIESWAPNQLRHSCATLLRSQFGLEAAQTVLGHSQADITQVYAERDFAKAQEIMRQVG